VQAIQEARNQIKSISSLPDGTQEAILSHWR
jgi:hypothetical protein